MEANAKAKPNPWLIGTSLLFAIPTTTAAYYRQWVPYSSTLAMTLISSVYHATKDPTLLVLDKACCYYLTAVNVSFAITHGVVAVPVLACAYCLCVFHIGYLTKRFVYAKNKADALPWHISMHLVVMSSVLYGSLRIGAQN